MAWYRRISALIAPQQGVSSATSPPSYQYLTQFAQVLFSPSLCTCFSRRLLLSVSRSLSPRPPSSLDLHASSQATRHAPPPHLGASDQNRPRRGD